MNVQKMDLPSLLKDSVLFPRFRRAFKEVFEESWGETWPDDVVDEKFRKCAEADPRPAPVALLFANEAGEEIVSGFCVGCFDTLAGTVRASELPPGLNGPEAVAAAQEGLKQIYGISDDAPMFLAREVAVLKRFRIGSAAFQSLSVSILEDGFAMGARQMWYWTAGVSPLADMAAGLEHKVAYAFGDEKRHVVLTGDLATTISIFSLPARAFAVKLARGAKGK